MTIVDAPAHHRHAAAHRLVPRVGAGHRLALAVVAAGVVGTGLQAPSTPAAIAAPPAPAAGQDRPVDPLLRHGSTGDPVRDLQRVLNAWYPMRTALAVDGVFGPRTEATVRELQRRSGIPVDGIVGPQTRGVLGMGARSGDAPAAAPAGPKTDRSGSSPPPAGDPQAGPKTSDDRASEPPASEPPAPEPPDSEASASEPPASESPASGPPAQEAEASAVGVARPAVGRFTSGFGPRWGRSHNGIDIANAIGTPIHAAKGGTVIDSGPAQGFGLWVRVRHHDGDISVYGHINETLVRTGQQVETGEQIATMGNRGQSTGPHLHFEILQGGTNKIDPRTWLRDRGVEV